MTNTLRLSAALDLALTNDSNLDAETHDALVAGVEALEKRCAEAEAEVEACLDGLDYYGEDTSIEGMAESLCDAVNRMERGQKSKLLACIADGRRSDIFRYVGG